MAAESARDFSVQWAASAESDLTSIVDYIATDDLQKALVVLQRIRKAASALNRFPARGRIVPELHEQGVELYRELITGPWRIMYRIVGKTVLALAVIDARRNVEDLLLERFLSKG